MVRGELRCNASPGVAGIGFAFEIWLEKQCWLCFELKQTTRKERASLEAFTFRYLTIGLGEWQMAEYEGLRVRLCV